MKLIHIVLVKFKQGTTSKVINQALKDVVALKDTIPQITVATAGKTITDRSKGYEHGWVVELEKKEDLSLYAEHESHLKFLSEYKEHFEDVLAVDYEA